MYKFQQRNGPFLNKTQIPFSLQLAFKSIFHKSEVFRSKAEVLLDSQGHRVTELQRIKNYLSYANILLEDGRKLIRLTTICTYTAYVYHPYTVYTRIYCIQYILYNVLTIKASDDHKNLSVF